MKVKWVTLVLLMLPLGLVYPIIYTIVNTYGTPEGVRFYFSMLYGPDSLSPITANIYVFTMVMIAVLYLLQIFICPDRGLVYKTIGTLNSTFALLLVATGMYYPILHRIYAPTSIIIAILYLVAQVSGLFRYSVMTLLFPVIMVGLLTMITWQIIPNDLWFSIGQLSLFLVIYYEFQISQVIFELNWFHLSPLLRFDYPLFSSSSSVHLPSPNSTFLSNSTPKPSYLAPRVRLKKGWLNEVN